MEDFFDSKGRKIEEFDVLKFYHFTGARKKKYYMYKWAQISDGWLVAHHLSKHDKNSFCSLRGLSKDENGYLVNIEIIQSINWEKLD